VLVFDDATFDRVAAHQLAAQELPCSLTSVVFSGDDTPYYAVGTAIVKPEEYEPQKGRLLLLAYRRGRGAGGGGRGREGNAAPRGARRQARPASAPPTRQVCPLMSRQRSALCSGGPPASSPFAIPLSPTGVAGGWSWWRPRR
jgi:hypothetical protein